MWTLLRLRHASRCPRTTESARCPGQSTEMLQRGQGRRAVASTRRNGSPRSKTRRPLACNDCTAGSSDGGRSTTARHATRSSASQSSRDRARSANVAVKSGGNCAARNQLEAVTGAAAREVEQHGIRPEGEELGHLVEGGAGEHAGREHVARQAQQPGPQPVLVRHLTHVGVPGGEVVGIGFGHGVIMPVRRPPSVVRRFVAERRTTRFRPG